MISFKYVNQLYILVGLVITLQTSYTHTVIIEDIGSGIELVANLAHSSNDSIVSSIIDPTSNDTLATCNALLSSEQYTVGLLNKYQIISTIVLLLIGFDHLFDISGCLGRRKGIEYHLNRYLSAAILSFVYMCGLLVSFDTNLTTEGSALVLAQIIGCGIILLNPIRSLITKVLCYAQSEDKLIDEHNELVDLMRRRIPMPMPIAADNNQHNNQNIQIRNTIKLLNCQDNRRIEHMLFNPGQDLEQGVHVDRIHGQHHIKTMLMQQIARLHLALNNNPPDRECAICRLEGTSEQEIGMIPCTSGALHSERIHQSCLEDVRRRVPGKDFRCMVCDAKLISNAIISDAPRPLPLLPAIPINIE